MTVLEYFSIIYENVCNYLNMNPLVTMLALTIWAAMTVLPFVMNCKGMRTTFLTPFMWTVLNLLFGPVAWGCFLIFGCLPLRNYIRPVDTKWNLILPVIVATAFSRFRILDESNILGIVVGTIAPAVITIALIIIRVCIPHKSVYIDKNDIGKYEYRLRYNYMHNRGERKKLRTKSEYTFQIYNSEEHKLMSVTTPMVSQELIDSCFLIKLNKFGPFKEAIYRKANQDEISVLQLDYPIESYLYSYLVGVLIMLWINLPYLMMVVNHINRSLEG